jgi:hypothetical protein
MRPRQLGTWQWTWQDWQLGTSRDWQDLALGRIKYISIHILSFNQVVFRRIRQVMSLAQRLWTPQYHNHYSLTNRPSHPSKIPCFYISHEKHQDIGAARHGMSASHIKGGHVTALHVKIERLRRCVTLASHVKTRSMSNLGYRKSEISLGRVSLHKTVSHLHKLTLSSLKPLVRVSLPCFFISRTKHTASRHVIALHVKTEKHLQSQILHAEVHPRRSVRLLQAESHLAIIGNQKLESETIKASGKVWPPELHVSLYTARKILRYRSALRHVCFACQTKWCCIFSQSLQFEDWGNAYKTNLCGDLSCWLSYLRRSRSIGSAIKGQSCRKGRDVVEFSNYKRRRKVYKFGGIPSTGYSGTTPNKYLLTTSSSSWTTQYW